MFDLEKWAKECLVIQSDDYPQYYGRKEGFLKALELLADYIEENSHTLDHTDWLKYIEKLKGAK